MSSLFHITFLYFKYLFSFLFFPLVIDNLYSELAIYLSVYILVYITGIVLYTLFNFSLFSALCICTCVFNVGMFLFGEKGEGEYSK